MHPCDASLLDAYPISTPCDVACHAFFVPPVWLSLLLCILFAHLTTCLCMSLCFLLSSILESNGTMDTRSKPTFVLLGHPFLLDNMLVCWLVSSIFACTCMEHGNLEQGCNLLGASKNGKNASKKMRAHKGQCSVD